MQQDCHDMIKDDMNMKENVDIFYVQQKTSLKVIVSSVQTDFIAVGRLISIDFWVGLQVR